MLLHYQGIRMAQQVRFIIIVFSFPWWLDILPIGWGTMPT